GEAAKPALAIDLRHMARDLRHMARQAGERVMPGTGRRLAGTWRALAGGWRLGGLRIGFGGSIEQWGRCLVCPSRALLALWWARSTALTGSKFLEAVADAVERFDHVEVVVDGLELLAQPLDVA